MRFKFSWVVTIDDWNGKGGLTLSSHDTKAEAEKKAARLDKRVRPKVEKRTVVDRATR
jgi:hypothetical protein